MKPHLQFDCLENMSLESVENGTPQCTLLNRLRVLARLYFFLHSADYRLHFDCSMEKSTSPQGRYIRQFADGFSDISLVPIQQRP